MIAQTVWVSLSIQNDGRFEYGLNRCTLHTPNGVVGAWEFQVIYDPVRKTHSTLDIPVTGRFMLTSEFEVRTMFQIGELSDRTGVPAKTIRYYEDIGLLSAAKRGENRYRLYDQKDVERLRFVRSARALNFSLQEIAETLAARDRHEPPCSHVMELMRGHIDDIETRIRELEQLRDELMSLYDAGQHLPYDVQMRSCVCHLIQIGVSKRNDHE